MPPALQVDSFNSWVTKWLSMHVHVLAWGFPGVTVLKKTQPVNAGNTRSIGSIPWSGRSPRERNVNSLQYSCLNNSMHRGAWQTTVHGVTNSWTWLSMHAQHYYVHTGLAKVKLCSCVWLFATPWTVAYQAPPSMGFSRQGSWSGLPFPSLILA